MRLVTKILVRFTNDNCSEQNATMSCIFEGSDLATRFGIRKDRKPQSHSKRPIPVRRGESELVNFTHVDKATLKKVLEEEIGHLAEDEGSFNGEGNPVMYIPAAGVAMQSLLNFIRATEEMHEKEYAAFKDDPDDENGEDGFNPPPEHSLEIKVYLLVAKLLD